MTTNTRDIHSWFFNDNWNNLNKRADASLIEKKTRSTRNTRGIRTPFLNDNLNNLNNSFNHERFR